MTQKSILNDYAQVLKKHEFDYEICEESKEVPNNHLNFSIGADAAGRQRQLILRIQPYPTLTPEEMGTTKNESSNDETAVQFSFRFPYRVDKECIGELSRLIMYYNRSLDFPGLGFDEPNNFVYYQYTYLQPPTGVPANTFISIIGMIMLYLDMLEDSIERVAKGEKIDVVLKENFNKYLPK